MSPGELVLVHRAGSGSGSAAVQVAGVWGGKVIACDDSEQNLEKAIASGADYAINYRERDFYEQVLELSNGRGADMVVEQQGNNTWERSLNCVARNGRLVVVGFGAAEKVNLDLQTLISQQLIVIGSFGYSKDDLKEVLRLTEEGRMQAVVDNVYTLEESGAAFARLDSRDRFGKVLIKF
jgi:NADPH:quinone reductase-like Zn-dependent oxidoreductase